MSVIEDYDGLLLDLDGTVWEGGRAIADAVESIESSGLPAAYITNNASRSPAEVASMLNAIKLPASAEDILTSAQAAAALVRREYPQARTAYVLGGQAFRELIEAAGLIVVDSADDHPDVVLHGHSPSTGWPELTEAALAIRHGAAYIASNVDTTLPIERGLAVGNGSMVAAITSATGVTPISAGKPEPEMYLQAARDRGWTRPLAVGDRLDTDIAGGNAAGFDTLQVLTGVSGPWALITAERSHRPTLVCADLRDLARPASELRPGPQGGFHASVEGSTVVLGGGTEDADPIEALRTALEAAWSITTPPGDVDVQSASPAAERAIAAWRS